MMEGWYLLATMAQLRCGMPSGKNLCSISEDIEAGCYVLRGPQWIQNASTQAQMTSVSTGG